jgi:hypothetical protein
VADVSSAGALPGVVYAVATLGRLGIGMRLVRGWGRGRIPSSRRRVGWALGRLRRLAGTGRTRGNATENQGRPSRFVLRAATFLLLVAFALV